MVDENELQKPTEDIKAFNPKKNTVVTSGIIVFFLTLSTVSYYAYQKGLFNNLFKEMSVKETPIEGEDSIVEETLAEGENLESKNN